MREHAPDLDAQDKRDEFIALIIFHALGVAGISAIAVAATWILINWMMT